MRRTATSTALALALAMAVRAGAQVPASSLTMRMLAAEDARDSSEAGLAPLLEGLRDPDVEVQRRAVRAIGRFEDPALVPHIERMLRAAEASVRAEAANALAQAYHGQPSGMAGAAIARAALERESHALVRGALLLALGRLKYPTLDEWRAAEVLLTDTLFPEQPGGRRGVASPAVLLNGLRGLQHLARQAPDKRSLHQVTVAALARLAAPPGRPGRPSKATRTATVAASSRIRLLALQALRAGRVTDPGPYAPSRFDPDPAVRRVAVVPITAGPLLPPGFLDLMGSAAAASGASTASAAQAKLLRAAEQGLRRQLEDDPSPTVRLEALRGYLQQQAPDCGLLRRRLDDASVHVVVMALDGLAKPCARDAETTTRLAAIASGASNVKAVAKWHVRAHALVALAQADSATAARHVHTAARDGNPWVRMYAARALRHIVATGAGRDDQDVTLLRSMTADTDVNVATAAVESLRATVGHAADAEYLAALARDDRAPRDGATGIPIGYELVIAAVEALAASPRADVTGPMLDALDRLTAERRETSRDARLAILTWLEAHGGAMAVDRLARYATDFDPRIANKAAAFVSSKTGVAVIAAPARLPRAPLPGESELAELKTTKVVLQMADGGRVTIGLLSDEAPLSAARFVRLADAGYFTGRTIHRVVANFVAQGGSPGANEHAGDGPFSRDEVGMVSNADGTVGVSTRGRDTGDGQFYVNLADNTRLDHTYTVFGVIESGRDIAERWQEGDVIARVTVLRRP